MNVLLDTHILLWLVSTPSDLDVSAAAVIASKKTGRPVDERVRKLAEVRKTLSQTGTASAFSVDACHAFERLLLL